MRLAGIFLAVFVLAGCGESTNSDGEPNTLSGMVTMAGEPVEYNMIVAVGPGGKEVSAPRKADGSYRIVSPPTGLLKFKFAAGPPIPGGPAKLKTGNIPVKYLSPKSELEFEYKGGNQTFDIELKP